MKMTLKTSLFHEAESLVDAITDITLTKKCAKPEPILSFVVSEEENPLFSLRKSSLLIVVPLVHTRLMIFSSFLQIVAACAGKVPQLFEKWC